MFLAPITAFLTGLALGFIKGFRRPTFSLRGALALGLVLGVPALLLHLNGADPAIFALLLGGLLVTYLFLQAGLLIGDRIAKWRGHRAS